VTAETPKEPGQSQFFEEVLDESALSTVMRTTKNPLRLDLEKPDNVAKIRYVVDDKEVSGETTVLDALVRSNTKRAYVKIGDETLCTLY
jgi:hypothetical protein